MEKTAETADKRTGKTMSTEHQKARSRAFETFAARRQNRIERAREERDRTIRAANTTFERAEEDSNLAEMMERKSWDTTHRATQPEISETGGQGQR